MLKKYNVFIKRDQKGIFKKTILLKTSFRFIIFFVFFIFSNLIFPLYLINFAISLYISFYFGGWFSKILIKVGYEYLGYTTGKNKIEAKQNFLNSIKKDL
jgi:hypothetical protein